MTIDRPRKIIGCAPGWILGFVLSPAAPEAAPADASAPVSRQDDYFWQRHAAILKRRKEGPIDLLFLGDSITDCWSDAPAI